MTSSPLVIPWRSPDGIVNAHAIQAQYASALGAIAAVDALGHRLLHRVGLGLAFDRIEALVTVALLRRAVTQFVGIRHLLEASVVEQAKLGVRAQFETYLTAQYLFFGGRRHVTLHTRSSPARREARSNYYYVAAERRSVYSRYALLDGRWGGSAMNRKARRAILKEAEETNAKLARDFPAQQAAFGPIRCRGVAAAKRRYHDAREWFSFGFPKGQTNNIRSLAVRLGHVREYETLYAALSGLTHPRGISHDMSIKGQTATVYHPYMADAFEFLCTWTLAWQMMIICWVNRIYDPASFSDAQQVFKTVRPVIHALDDSMPDGWW